MNSAVLSVIMAALTPKNINGFLAALATKIITGKSLLSHRELVRLVDAGVINAKYENINATSIDITLDDILLVESKGDFKPIDLANKENINMHEFKMGRKGYVVNPNEFLLASSSEVFNLPDNISCEYKLKSSQARNGLDHANAGWCDAGWNDSKLTLEFKNISRFHQLRIRAGMKCGQVVFFKHKKVSKKASYSTKGQYNGQKKVQESKELR